MGKTAFLRSSFGIQLTGHTIHSSKAHSCMDFSIFSHATINTTTFRAFHHSYKKPYILSHHLQPLHPWQLLIFSQSLCIFFWTFHIHSITQAVVFCVWIGLPWWRRR